MNRKEEKYDPYKVKVFETSKDDKEEQPRACKIGIFPSKLERFHTLLVGRSGSGKTNVMLHMLTNENLLGGVFKPKNIYLFCAVKADKSVTKALKIPKKNIIENFDDDKVLDMFKKLESTIESKGWSSAPRTLWLFDDIISRKKFLRGKALTQLAVAGRHAKLSYIFISQYWKKIPNVLRTNAAYVIYFSANENENEKFAEEMAPSFMSKKRMKQMIEFATKEPYSFMSVNTMAEKGKELRKGFNTIIS
jgi:hypothetical protein